MCAGVPPVLCAQEPPGPLQIHKSLSKNSSERENCTQLITDMANTTAPPTDNTSSSSSTKTTPPKKANLLDHHSIKHLLDQTVAEIVKSRGYPEDVRLSNLKLLLGTIIISIAVFAQFYPKKFPGNKDFLIVCIALYVLFNLVLHVIMYAKEKNAILFTYPPNGSFISTGLVVSSKFPRFSDMYTLLIESADPKSISAKKPVQFSKSVTKWFTTDGILVEGLFWKDVNGLINEYSADSSKNK